MTKDCSLNYQFCTWKVQVVYINCFLLFVLTFRTIYVHNMFWPCNFLVLNNLLSYCKLNTWCKNKTFFIFFFKKAKAASALRNRLWSEVKQTSHGDNIFFQYIKPPHSIVKWSNFTIPFHYQCFGNLKSIQQTHQNCWKLKNKQV